MEITSKIIWSFVDGGVLDWQELEEYIKELLEEEVPFKEILEEIEEFCENFKINPLSNFNYVMYVVLNLYQNIIKEKMVKFYPELKHEIWEYDVYIYTNYRDSGFNDPINEYNLKDFNEKEVVDEILSKWGILNIEILGK